MSLESNAVNYIYNNYVTLGEVFVGNENFLFPPLPPLEALKRIFSPLSKKVHKHHKQGGCWKKKLFSLLLVFFFPQKNIWRMWDQSKSNTTTRTRIITNYTLPMLWTPCKKKICGLRFFFLVIFSFLYIFLRLNWKLGWSFQHTSLKCPLFFFQIIPVKGFHNSCYTLYMNGLVS